MICTKCKTRLTMRWKRCDRCRRRISGWHHARVAGQLVRFCEVHRDTRIIRTGCRRCAAIRRNQRRWANVETRQSKLRATLAQGWISSVEIAAALGVSENSVRIGFQVLRRRTSSQVLEARWVTAIQTRKPVKLYRLVSRERRAA